MKLLVTTLAVVLSLSGNSLAASSDQSPPVNLWTGEGVSLGKVLVPSVSFLTAFGTSTADDPSSLAVGHHDPDRRGWTIQNVEFSLAANLGQHLSLFALYAAKVDLDDHWDDHFEEYYFTVKDLPGGLRVRGGRLYTKFGYQNVLHPHDFDWVDQYLANGRFLGDDALTIYGGELSAPLPWVLPAGWSDRLTASIGAVPDAEEHEHHGAHSEPEPEFEPEGALMQDWAVTANYTARYDHNEHHRYEAGISGAWGRNHYDRLTQVYGAHLTYAWFENGPDDPGRSLTWKTEVMLRHFGAQSAAGHDAHAHNEAEAGEEHAHEEEDEGDVHEEHADEAHSEEEEHGHEEDEHAEEPLVKSFRRNFTDVGLYSSVAYNFSRNLAAQVRGEYVSGVDAVGLDEHWRISPAITWKPTERFDVQLRVQYNYDHSSAFGEEHTIWTQIKVGWGGHRH